MVDEMDSVSLMARLILRAQGRFSSTWPNFGQLHGDDIFSQVLRT
jgi:hypothetical protein